MCRAEQALLLAGVESEDELLRHVEAIAAFMQHIKIVGREQQRKQSTQEQETRCLPTAKRRGVQRDPASAAHQYDAGMLERAEVIRLMGNRIGIANQDRERPIRHRKHKDSARQQCSSQRRSQQRPGYRGHLCSQGVTNT